jgi:hypothetical protein
VLYYNPEYQKIKIKKIHESMGGMIDKKKEV